MTGAIDTTVVIPAFDEERAIARAVARVAEELQPLSVSSEILVVDDGSRDATRAAAEAAVGERGRVIALPGNRGKGAAVKAGMLAARGAYRLFIDADLSVDPRYLCVVRQELSDGADVVVTSRLLPGSRLARRQPWLRETMGSIYRVGTSLLLVPGISDFTCGLKGFTAKAALDLFGCSRIDRFGFDVEVLYIARRRRYQIRETAVEWTDDPDTRVRLLPDAARSLLELLSIPVNAVTGRYG